MDDFRFCGQSIAVFHAHAFFGKTTSISGGTTRSQYDVGNEEPLILSEKRSKAFQRQITIIPEEGVVATDEWQRAIINWLCDQRGQLILLRDSAHYRLAQFDGEAKFSRASWPHGALEITATMGTGVYSTSETAKSILVGTGGSSPVYFSTGEARPFRISIVPNSGAIYTVAISANGKSVVLSGMYAQNSIIVDQASERASVTVDGYSTFRNVTRWEKLVINSGDTVSITISGSAGTSTATVYVRGRWHA